VTDDERLAAFKAAHPSAVIDPDGGVAHIGGMTVRAPSLPELLAKLRRITQPLGDG
jgi:hypothetical protein